jgi:hypothetical protein
MKDNINKFTLNGEDMYVRGLYRGICSFKKGY